MAIPPPAPDAASLAAYAEAARGLLARGGFERSGNPAEASTLSTWLYGATTASVFAMLRDNPPRGDRVYTVQPGDSLG